METLPQEANHGNSHAISGDGATETVTPDLVNGSGRLPEELQRVYNSARWVPSKNTRIKYPTPKELIDPFLDQIAVSGLDAEFNVHTARARTVEENGQEVQHTAYGRVLAEAEFGDYNRHDTRKTVGLVYDLTRKSPIIKVYAGHNVRACVNLMIFNATHVYEGEILSGGEEQAKGHLERYFGELPEYEYTFMDQVDRLKDTYWGEAELNERLGRMLRNVHANNTFGAACLNYAVKLLDDNSSRYALDRDGGTTAWNFLQAMTQFVSDRKKDSAPQLVPTKSLQIGQEVAGGILEIDDQRTN